MRKVIVRAVCLASVFGIGVAPAVADPPMYTMVELGHIAPSSSSVAIAISDPTPAGPVVVGQSFTKFSSPSLSWRAVAWRPQVSSAPVDLLPGAGASTVNRAQDVSPSGRFIAGYSNTSPPHGVRWSFDPITGGVTRIDTLRALPGDGASEGVGVNSAGRVAGYSLTDSSTTRGATWAPGSTAATLLAAPAGSGGFRLAREISEAPAESIVGRSDMSSTPTTRAILWKKSGGGYATGQLLTLLSPGLVHDAIGISPDGRTAVGLGASPTAGRGVAWSTTTLDVFDLGSLGCCAENVVYDMNNAGVGVGYAALNFQSFRAVVFWDGGAIDLNTRIANNPQIGVTLFLHAAAGINSAGQIVGVFGGPSSDEPLSPERVFLLTPVP